MPESYTGQCIAVQSTFGSCAQRVDSLRTECTKSYTALTQWPGPCECTYYAQDLMCFDEQELCASQAWSQVPQWFRDGVTSCLAKDPDYTIRAQLGQFSVPFTVSGLAGSLAGETSYSQDVLSITASPGSYASGLPSATAAVAGTPASRRASLSGKSIAGIAGIVIGAVAFLILALLGLYLLSRRRKARGGANNVNASHELHAKSNVHEKDNTAIYEKGGIDLSELPPPEPFELFTEEAAQELDVPTTGDAGIVREKTF
ncbi:hypothetical protein CBER1_03089 [Cercospora berteroae]|uniref:Uncharacterized protein n=1 Tax=Cercospora berteroae TaxID=357750 RepID=A0A2S6CK83_9PEZI|nr:hypothetical protein CBER1_03089 [Cercospora berteroae]